jgi:hypothetical protein
LHYEGAAWSLKCDEIPFLFPYDRTIQRGTAQGASEAAKAKSISLAQKVHKGRV